MSASSASLASARISAAVGPRPSMRMSSGASKRSEKPRSGLIELHRGDADVERDAVEILRVFVELAEAGLDEPQPVGILGRQRRAAGDRRGVAVERDDAGAAFEHGARYSRRRRRCRRDRGRPRLISSAASVSSSSTGMWLTPPTPGRRSDFARPRPRRLEPLGEGLGRPDLKLVALADDHRLARQADDAFSRSLKVSRPSGSSFTRSPVPNRASARSSRCGE